MATAEHIPGSVLSTVVEHERSLLAKLEKAREEARATIERAKSEAIDIVQGEETRLAEESAGMRRTAETARNAAFDATVAAAEKQLVGIRTQAEGRVSDVADKVLSLFVPTGRGDWKS